MLCTNKNSHVSNTDIVSELNQEFLLCHVTTLLVMSMATSIQKIEPFDPHNGEKWTHYIKQLEYYFFANGIQASEKKQAILISVMVLQAYKLLRTLIYLVCPTISRLPNLSKC